MHAAQVQEQGGWCQVKTLNMPLQVTIQEWRLGWNFTAGEEVSQAQNIFTPGVNPVKLVNQTVQLQSQDANTTVEPLEWTYLNFLGTKAASPIPHNAYRVSTMHPALAPM